MDEQSFSLALASIIADRKSGASELARRCLDVMVKSAYEAPATNAVELIAQLEQRAAKLAAARPSMTPIVRLLEQWQTNAVLDPGTELAVLRKQAATAAVELIDVSHQAVKACAQQAAQYIGPNQTLFTHSLSSTVMEVFHLLREQGVSAIITESRPLYEGYILARQLSEWQIPTTLITDAQIGLFINQADAVLVGADSLLADGSLINKAGTYPLALAAHDQCVPFYVCCESFKCRTDVMGSPELETMDASELQAPSLPGVKSQNVYFDITPARLISVWFGENKKHAT